MISPRLRQQLPMRVRPLSRIIWGANATLSDNSGEWLAAKISADKLVDGAGTDRHISCQTRGIVASIWVVFGWNKYRTI
jgi:hypothetical protein